ncbi:hypothetical protein AQJ58_25115 [Streptomyces sp. DSM 15324]|nr:hypothetical protein AQJ58_25115 [Streptomyces sp. DSM 15324]
MTHADAVHKNKRDKRHDRGRPRGLDRAGAGQSVLPRRWSVERHRGLCGSGARALALGVEDPLRVCGGEVDGEAAEAAVVGGPFGGGAAEPAAQFHRDPTGGGRLLPGGLAYAGHQRGDLLAHEVVRFPSFVDSAPSSPVPQRQ